MTWTEIISLIAAIGTPTILAGAITWYFTQRERKARRKEELMDSTNAAKVGDSAKLRSELWEQFERERDRNSVLQETNTALSQRYGELLSKMGVTEGELKVKQAQVDELLARYSLAAQQKEDLEYRREKDREKFEARIDVLDKEKETIDASRDHLARRVIELEQDIARITRGAATRRTDSRAPVAKTIVEETRPEMRAAELRVERAKEEGQPHE